jgi:hypothetical protein
VTNTEKPCDKPKGAKSLWFQKFGSRSHVEILQDFGSSGLQEVLCIDNKEAFSAKAPKCQSVEVSNPSTVGMLDEY